jgi:hypothetical protein
MKVLYQCEICKELYDTPEKATICESTKNVSRFSVGQIVTARAGFGWYDGDNKWIANFDRLGEYIVPGKFEAGRIAHPGINCFCELCTYSFYYVITAIGRNPSDPHETAYHLATKAMTGTQRYRGGRTNWSGHYRPKVVSNPPEEIVRESKKLIGMQFSYLL